MPPKMKFYCADKKRSHSQPYIIYDASIHDKQERLEKGIRFETATQAAEYLGLRKIAHLNEYSSQEAILQQKKFKSPKHDGKLFIIRKLPK